MIYPSVALALVVLLVKVVVALDLVAGRSVVCFFATAPRTGSNDDEILAAAKKDDGKGQEECGQAQDRLLLE